MSRGRGKKLRSPNAVRVHLDLPEYRMHGIAMINQLAQEFPFFDIKDQVSANKEGRIVSLDYEKKWLQTLPTTWRFDGKKYDLVVPSDQRSWLDLAIASKNGDLWPINVKVGRKGESNDNIGGKRIFEYILLADKINPKTLAIEHPYGPMRNEQQLASKVAELVADPQLRPKTMREYFLLHYSHETNQTRALPLSAIKPEQLKVNPKNGLQLAMKRAEYAPGLDMNESWDNIAERYCQYLAAMAAPWIAFEKTVAAAKELKN